MGRGLRKEGVEKHHGGWRRLPAFLAINIALVEKLYAGLDFSSSDGQWKYNQQHL
jgi:hypothetical protein